MVRLLVLSISMFLTACKTPVYIAKSKAFPNFYIEHPLSVLVLPPVNETTAAGAGEYYAATIGKPLAEAGYYVYPVDLVFDILHYEGLYFTEELPDISLKKIREYFGADAVLYTTIKKWSTLYYVLGGSVTVSVDFLMKSTITGRVMWRYSGTLSHSTSGGGFGTPIELIVRVVMTAIKTIEQDYVSVAEELNNKALKSIPLSRYSPLYDKDGDVQILKQSVE